MTTHITLGAATLALVLLSGARAQQLPTMPEDGPLVTKLPGGLTISTLKEGAGETAKRGSRITLHYATFLTDGRLVETSLVRGQPDKLTLGVAMPIAWTRALSKMKAGQRCKVTAPAKFAYGEVGVPARPPKAPAVPAGATVVFDLQLQAVEKGVELPEFRLPDPKAQKTTDSGLKFEVLAKGTGERPREGELFTVGFTLYNERGQLVQDSRCPGDRPFVGRLGRKLPGPRFLREAVSMLRPGGRYRFVVPAEMAWGKRGVGYLIPPDTETIWELELLRLDAAPQPRPVPAFARLNLAKMQRTKSGLRYEIVKPGKGEPPPADASLEIHLIGWRVDREHFVETYSGGVPERVELARPAKDLTKGLLEAIRMMPVGAVYRLVVPAELAYGALGRKELEIGPNQRIHYQVELVRVVGAR